MCKECKTTFNIQESHKCEVSQQSSSLTLLTDLMDISTEDEITKEINDAVVHVIRKKMDGSQLPNKSIVLQTGGRVRIIINHLSINNILSVTKCLREKIKQKF